MPCRCQGDVFNLNVRVSALPGRAGRAEEALRGGLGRRARAALILYGSAGRDGAEAARSRGADSGGEIASRVQFEANGQGPGQAGKAGRQADGRKEERTRVSVHFEPRAGVHEMVSVNPSGCTVLAEVGPVAVLFATQDTLEQLGGVRT